MLLVVVVLVLALVPLLLALVRHPKFLLAAY